MRHALILLNGPTPGAGVTIDGGTGDITLGRDAARTLPVDDNRCSRLHARLWCEGERWHLEDCESSNGTFVNSRRIDRVSLRPGDVIRVGETLIVFSREYDADDPNRPGRRLASSTFMMRVSEQDARPLLTDRVISEESGMARSVAVLCQLATELHRTETRDEMTTAVCEAVVRLIDADTVTIWLAGADGRLSAVGRRSAPERGQVTDAYEIPVLASIAVENNEALLVQNGRTLASTVGHVDKAEAVTIQDDSAQTAISVPIPGRSARLGAIECLVDAAHGTFQEHDLDLVIAVAHQAGLALENLEHRERLERANQQLRTVVHGQDRLVGNSRPMKRLLDTISRVGPVDSMVLIKGESGTGKELVARMIHETSQRHAGPYIPINCAAFSESLLESELFGHEKGAFTGADQRRIGQFERAHTGTLFLDEIGELSAACQARLLRILEHHPFERVGGTEPIQVDVRIVAATHRELPDLVAEGRFRDDLYFRLRVIEVEIPPLRRRGDDMILLAEHYLHQFRHEMGRGPQSFSGDAIRLMTDYQWPGNVRELRNAIERAVVLSRSDQVQCEDLALPFSNAVDDDATSLLPLADAELRHIVAVLNEVDGNKTRACKVLGIGRGTLYKKLEEYELRKKATRRET